MDFPISVVSSLEGGRGANQCINHLSLTENQPLLVSFSFSVEKYMCLNKMLNCSFYLYMPLCFFMLKTLDFQV